MIATVMLANGHGAFDIVGHNQILEGCIGADLLLNTSKIEGTVSGDFTKADLYQMRLVGKPLTIGTNGSLKVFSDMKNIHYVSGRLNDVYVKDARKTYNPGDVGILLKTNPDTTYARIQSGDFILKLDARGGYQKLLSQATVLTDSVMGQFHDNIIDQPAIKALLPVMSLHLESKRDNPVANFLRATGTDFKEMTLDLTTSPETGINGKGHIFSLNYDSIRIDTIRLSLIQRENRLSYQGQICNNKRNPQFVFNALIDGHIHEHGALAGLRYYDDKGRMGSKDRPHCRRQGRYEDLYRASRLYDASGSHPLAQSGRSWRDNLSHSLSAPYHWKTQWRLPYPTGSGRKILCRFRYGRTKYDL